MPEYDDSLGGQTMGGDDNDRPIDQSLGDQNTFDDSQTGEEVSDDDMEIIDLSTRYTEEGVLGKGGMGEVLLAIDTLLNRNVAIKRILGKAARSKTATKRFLTEAQSIAALNHNNIIQIYDFGRSTDGPFLIMECVQGGSLLDKCKEGPIELDEAVKIFSQLCDGLAKAHSANIIHRDIKPANVLMTEDGVPKLTDFGLAKDDAADTGMTMQGAVIGTLDFMPPEQREGAHLTDHRSDLWSLAATFYQMLTGKSPKVINITAVPKELQSVMGKALEESKEDRYQSALELKESVQQALTSGLDLSRDLGQGECPNCGTSNPSDRKFCRNPECASSLEADCLDCKQSMPVWESVCGSCGVVQGPLLDKARQSLEEKHKLAEDFLNALAFEQATATAGEISSETHPRLQQYAEWHEEFMSRLEATRESEHARLGELLKEAITHEEAFDYDAALKTLASIRESLSKTEITPYGNAYAIMMRVQTANNDVDSILFSNDVAKKQALRELEQFKFDDALRSVDRITTNGHPRLQASVDWKEEFLASTAATRDNEFSKLRQQIDEAINLEDAYQFDEALDVLVNVNPLLEKQLDEGITVSAADLRIRLEDKVEKVNSLTQSIQERIKERTPAGLDKLVNDLLAIKPDAPKMEALAQKLAERKSNLFDALNTTIAEASELYDAQRYEEALSKLESVSEEVREQEYFDLHQKCSNAIEQLKALRKRIHETVQASANNEKPINFEMLAGDIDSCLALMGNQPDIISLKGEIKRRWEEYNRRHAATLSQANHHLEQGQPEKAMLTMNSIPPHQHTTNTRRMHQIISFYQSEKKKLLNSIGSSSSTQAIPAITDYLDLLPDSASDVELNRKLANLKTSQLLSNFFFMQPFVLGVMYLFLLGLNALDRWYWVHLVGGGILSMIITATLVITHPQNWIGKLSVSLFGAALVYVSFFDYAPFQEGINDALWIVGFLGILVVLTDNSTQPRPNTDILLRFNRDGSLFAIGRLNGDVSIYNAQTNDCVRHFQACPKSASLADIEFFPDSNSIACFSDGSRSMLRVWDIYATPWPLYVVENATSIAFNLYGDDFACGYGHGFITTHNLSDGAIRYTTTFKGGHTSVAYAQKGELLLASSGLTPRKKTVKNPFTNENVEITVTPRDTSITVLKQTHDASFFSQEKRAAAPVAVGELKTSPDDSSLISWQWNDDHTSLDVVLCKLPDMTFDKLNIKYNAGTSTPHSGSQFEDSGILGVSVSPNGQLLAIRMTKGLTLWNLHTKSEIAKIDGHGAGPFSFTADSKRIAFVASDSSVYFYDMGSNQLLMTSKPTKQLQM